jgi:hypothetical protein
MLVCEAIVSHHKYPDDGPTPLESCSPPLRMGCQERILGEPISTRMEVVLVLVRLSSIAKECLVPDGRERSFP